MNEWARYRKTRTFWFSFTLEEDVRTKHLQGGEHWICVHSFTSLCNLELQVWTLKVHPRSGRGSVWSGDSISIHARLVLSFAGAITGGRHRSTSYTDATEKEIRQRTEESGGGRFVTWGVFCEESWSRNTLFILVLSVTWANWDLSGSRLKSESILFLVKQSCFSEQH